MKYPSITLSMLQRQLISLALATLLFADPIFATERGVQRVEIPLPPKAAAIRAVNLLRDFQPLIYFSISKVWAVWSGKVG